jgi:hypothetical protein
LDLPSGAPWTDISFVGVYHKEEERLESLLQLARKWFTHVIVGVQTDDMENDETLRIASEYADIVIVDKVAGLAEPTLHKILKDVPTDWSLVISGDERPTEQLLASLQEMLDYGINHRVLGFWIRFVSSIEGVAYPSEQDNHLRMFRTMLGWPSTMHSRPPVQNGFFWPPEKGVIYHDRSLDEMMVDYLRYLKMSGSTANWVNHNKLMMHDACAATAIHKGWEFIESFDWWPKVKAIAFDSCKTECRMPQTRYDCLSNR